MVGVMACGLQRARDRRQAMSRQNIKKPEAKQSTMLGAEQNLA